MVLVFSFIGNIVLEPSTTHNTFPFAPSEEHHEFHTEQSALYQIQVSFHKIYKMRVYVK